MGLNRTGMHVKAFSDLGFWVRAHIIRTQNPRPQAKRARTSVKTLTDEESVREGHDLCTDDEAIRTQIMTSC